MYAGKIARLYAGTGKNVHEKVARNQGRRYGKI